MKLYIRAHDIEARNEKELIERLGSLGFDGVQLVCYKVFDKVKYEPGIMTDELASSIHDLFSANGVEIPLIGAYFNPVHPDPVKSGKGKEIFRDYLKFARKIGSDTVGSETGSFNGDKWTYNPLNRTDEALETVVETFRGLCDTALENDVYVGMEGAFGHVCHSPDRLLEAVNKIDRPNIRIIFDLYNYLDRSNVKEMYGILEHGLELFGDRIHVFHIKDCKYALDGSLRQCPVGEGIFDYDRILSLIRSAQPDAKLVFEGTTGKAIDKSLKFIRKYM